MTPSQTLTSSPFPTATLAGVQYCVNVRTLNVRAGPGIVFPAIAWLTFQDCSYFDGRLEDGSWLRLSPGQGNFSGGWVNSEFL